jgi:hypothetical protein
VFPDISGRVLAFNILDCGVFAKALQGCLDSLAERQSTAAIIGVGVKPVDLQMALSRLDRTG